MAQIVAQVAARLLEVPLGWNLLVPWGFEKLLRPTSKDLPNLHHDRGLLLGPAQDAA